MDFEILSRIYHDEQTRDALTVLPSGYYEDITVLVRSLNDERKTCQSYKEREKLDDIIKNIRVVYEGIGERRLGKLMDGLKLDVVPENMTTVEAEFYDKVSGDLAEYTHTVRGRLDEAFGSCS
jgi:DNA replication initiation complex subunit (GINS family)